MQGTKQSIQISLESKILASLHTIWEKLPQLSAKTIDANPGLSGVSNNWKKYDYSKVCIWSLTIHPMLSKINNYQRKQKKTRKTFYYSINIIIQIYIYRTRTLRFVSRYTRSSDVTDQQNQNVYFLIYFLVYFLIYFLVYLEEGEKLKFDIEIWI